MSIETTVAAASHLLANRFGGAQELSQPEDLGGDGPALVLRVRVAPNPFLQERTVVVKQLLPLSDDAGDSGAAMIREVVAYQYTNTLAEHLRPGPLLLAHDLDQRLMILSDAGDGVSFTDVLTLGDAEARRSGLRKLGRALGTMHAATSSGEASFETLHRRQCMKHGVDPDGELSRDVDVAGLASTGIRLLEDDGVPVNPTVRAFAEDSSSRHGHQHLRAFTPFDLTPDNIMLTERVVFLDYEWAGFRDVAFDVASVIAGFPQDTTTPLPDEGDVTEFIAAWRSEVEAAWPAVRDDAVLAGSVMTALIGWALMGLSLLHYGTLDVRRAGQAGPGVTRGDGSHISTMPQEHLRDLATTAEAIRRFAGAMDDPRFPAVGEFAGALLERLARLGATPQVR
ncbi:hypothetical protein [Corynebacterium bovis]|uniref:hypothetical protein n=1 Tax=Corynebacterium bovis TaxID=36808 RepID=UPI00313862A9